MLFLGEHIDCDLRGRALHRLPQWKDLKLPMVATASCDTAMSAIQGGRSAAFYNSQQYRWSQWRPGESCSEAGAAAQPGESAGVPLTETRLASRGLFRFAMARGLGRR
jgi:hypothetical protein